MFILFTIQNLQYRSVEVRDHQCYSLVTTQRGA